MRPYEGLLTAMVTPFGADGRVDEETAVGLGRHLLASGSDGLVIAGTTGEASTLSDDEHIGLVELMVSELGGEAPIVAGTGSNDTRHAVELTERAVAVGAHAVLSVTGYYNKPNLRGIRRHYELVAQAAAGVPVVLYNIPSRTAVNLPPDFLAELAQLDGVEAVKQANDAELRPIDGLAVLAGNDNVLARVLDFGGAGGVCVASHVAGPQMREMFDASPERRAEIDAMLQPVYAGLFCTANPAPVKAALRMLGHDAGGLRLPLVECDQAEERIVRESLAAAGLLSGVHAS